MVIRGAAGAPGLDKAEVAQAGLLAVKVALAATVASRRASTPDVVAGHSEGEIAAAYVAGLLSLSDGAEVVATRSRLMAGLAGGRGDGGHRGRAEGGGGAGALRGRGRYRWRR